MTIHKCTILSQCLIMHSLVSRCQILSNSNLLRHEDREIIGDIPCLSINYLSCYILDKNKGLILFQFV